jgi:lycopene cyclase domain-containing protein
MNPHYTYLWVDFCCIIFPFLFSFHPRLQFARHWKAFLYPSLLTAAFFLVWDGIFTDWQVWSFNPDYVLGIYFFKMPIEEFLFFLCIPYACVFSYHCFKVLFKLDVYQQFARLFYAVAAIALLLIACFHLPQLYTSVTFVLCGIFLLYLVAVNHPLLSCFFFTYLFILLPFVLSNGVLTGSFLHRTVVQYNDQYNLGIRLLTIPIEDIFYGMLMLLLNVWGYEKRLATQ